jgi:ArsR family transcriptional regulator
LIVLDMLSHDRAEYREELGHHWLGFSQGQISSWLEATGWELETFVTLPIEAEAKGTPVFVATAKRTEKADR